MLPTAHIREVRGKRAQAVSSLLAVREGCVFLRCTTVVQIVAVTLTDCHNNLLSSPWSQDIIRCVCTARSGESPSSGEYCTYELRCSVKQRLWWYTSTD